MSSENVNHPSHYMSDGGVEAIDVIDSFFHDSFHLGNVFKYIARAGRKGDYVEDLQKAAWYLQREIGRHVPQAAEEVVRLRDEVDRLKWHCLDSVQVAEAEARLADGEREKARQEGRAEAYYSTYLQITQGQHKESQ